LNKEKLILILEYVNEWLKENHLNLDLTIFQNSIITLIYDKRSATKDIDCVFGETNLTFLTNIL